MKYLIALIFFALILVQCSKQKTVVHYSESGNMAEKYEINEDSVKNGIYIGFYENGDTFEVSRYVNGVQEGTRKIFYEGNKLEILENYVRDTLVGLHQVFWPNGKLKRKMYFTDNAINGTLETYFESGAIKETVQMENNEENGPFVEYHENGQKAWEGTFEKGDNEIGLLVQFAENGDTIKKMMCDERYICRTFYRNEKYPIDN